MEQKIGIGAFMVYEMAEYRLEEIEVQCCKYLTTMKFNAHYYVLLQILPTKRKVKETDKVRK